MGETRVSFPGRHAGLSVTKWLHPACFAGHCLVVDYAPTGRAKCAGGGRAIGKGEARLVMRIKNCEGKVSSCARRF